MSRRTEINLKETVDKYGALKDEENALSKQTKALSSQIKEAILKSDSLDFTAGVYTATVSVINNDTFDGDKAVKKATELLESGKITKEILDKLVTVQPVFNKEMLESLIYTGEIADASLFANCIVTKEPTYRLNIKKNK